MDGDRMLSNQYKQDDADQRYDDCVDEVENDLWFENFDTLADEWLSDSSAAFAEMCRLVADHKTKYTNTKVSDERAILNHNLVRGLSYAIRSAFKPYIEAEAQKRFDNPRGYYGD